MSQATVKPSLLEETENPLFDADWYVQAYPDVAASPLTPYQHYRRYGSSEGRLPNALLDPQWYLETYPELQGDGVDPLDHYYTQGWREGRNPGPSFDTAAYLAQNPEIETEGVNPLVHFLRQPPVPSEPDSEQEPAPSELQDPIATAGTSAHFEIEASRIAASIDQAWIVPGIGAFINGWLLDPDGNITSIHARLGSSRSPDVRGALLGRDRPDVLDAHSRWLASRATRQPGIVGLIPIDGVTATTTVGQLTFEFVDAQGRSSYLRAQNTDCCPTAPIEVIRELMTVAPPDDIVALDKHVGPSVAGIWASRGDVRSGYEIKEIGLVPEGPEVSIIVPLYGRFDFVEYQVALFADDPDLDGVELIYVVDDPRINRQVEALCQMVADVYQVPIKLVLCQENGGFARANNIGASVATGDTLLLLNSDVVPRGDGWLSGLREALASAPDAGTVAPLLLFPDGSVQHAGIAFAESRQYPGVWLNKHPGKGLPPHHSQDGEVTEEPAVTAACLLVKADTFKHAGGLDEDYIIGDFEDSDFCLSLREAGLKNYVAHGVELYHLERQSQHLDADYAWRDSLTMYNAWRHAKRWDAVIRSGVTESRDV